MASEIRATLRERFREPNKKLAALTGLDLSVWEPDQGGHRVGEKTTTTSGGTPSPSLAVQVK
jgi:hypothetical protein